MEISATHRNQKALIAMIPTPVKVMPYNVVAILISIAVVAVLSAGIYRGGGIASGIYLGALIGIFSVCTFVIHNYFN
jgi:archaellum biogenesis protein FlaJ (TadC family)